MFNVSDLDSFLNALTSFWNSIPNINEIPILTPEYSISFVKGESDRTLCSLVKRFQLDEIEVFRHTCPKFDKRILLINGKQCNLIQDCVEEIYFNSEKENSKNQHKNHDTQLYDPGKLSVDDIKDIEILHLDYGVVFSKIKLDQYLQISQNCM